MKTNANQSNATPPQAPLNILQKGLWRVQNSLFKVSVIIAIVGFIFLYKEFDFTKSLDVLIYFPIIVVLILIVLGVLFKKNFNTTLIKMDRYKNFIEFFNVIVIIFVFLAPGIIAMIYLGKISLGWSLSLIPGILIALILSNRKHWPRLTAFDTRYTREGYIQGASDYSRAYVTKAFDVNITTERQDKRDLIIIAIVFIGAIVWWYLKIN